MTDNIWYFPVDKKKYFTNLLRYQVNYRRSM